MMDFNKIKTVSLILLCVTTSLVAQNTEDFLRFLEARDESIKSYEIKLRRIMFDIDLDDYEAFKKSVEQLAQNEVEGQNASEQAEQLVKTWAEEVRWLERHAIWQGDRFKETLVFDSGSTTIKSYGGQLYYRYVVTNRQLDIHVKIPNVHHTNIGDLGLAIGGLRTRGKVLSFEQSEEGVRCVFSLSDDDSRTTTQEYDSNLGLYYSRYKLTERIQVENYYLFRKNIDGYSIPSIKIEISRYGRRNECSIWIYVIEDVKLNCLLTDEDLSLGDIPEKTLVIDKRFEPEIQWRYGEYCQAAANPDAVHDGRSTPEEMIQFLKDTSSDREALSTRDSRTGRKAPQLQIKEWLQKPISSGPWPPNRLTVINFWSIGCGFCIREIPENNELSEWLEDKGGLFISIHSAANEPQNIGELIKNIAEKLKEKSDLVLLGRPAAQKPQNINDFMDSNKIQYTVGLDEPDTQRTYWGSTTFAEYGIDSIPCYVIIDKDGNVISYERTVTKQKLEKLLLSESNGEAQQQTSLKDARKLTAIPNGWLAADLEPNSQVKGRFFVFRADTPEIMLRRLATTDRTIKSEWSKHTTDSQTVNEVLFTARTPGWGETLKGHIDLIAQYAQVEELVTIPYELQSRSLAKCVSPIIWFGPVQKGSSITRRITLQVDSLRKVSVSTVSVPSNLRLQILNREQKSNNIFVDCIFSSEKSGLQKGSVEFLAVDGENNKQSLELDYCAFVLP